MACRPERPKTGYTIDFSTAGGLDYVPLMRTRCGVSGSEIFSKRVADFPQLGPVGFCTDVDGRRTIREIAASLHSEASSRGSLANVERFARRLFQALWRLDILSMALNRE